MAERREHLRFALEARHPELVVGEDIAEDLQRDVASELGIARAVHLAHAPEPRAETTSQTRIRASAALPVDARRVHDIPRELDELVERRLEQAFDVAVGAVVLVLGAHRGPDAVALHALGA